MRNPQPYLVAAAAAALFVGVSVSAAHSDKTPAGEASPFAAAGASPLVQPALLTGTPASPASDPAGDADADTLDDLATLNPGVDEDELRDDAEELAEDLGVTPEAILEQQLAEAEESAAAASSAGAASQPSIVTVSSGGGDVTLGSAQRKGDIFISPASTLFIQHGHAGIYATPSTIVEAPGSGKKSRSALASDTRVGKGAVKQSVSTTQANRDKAANYAYNSMRGKPYNSNFAFNRNVPATKYNCSQLVWGAYKHTTSIDLDSNGGFGVYPYNIKDSSKTVTYKTL